MLDHGKGTAMENDREEGAGRQAEEAAERAEEAARRAEEAAERAEQAERKADEAERRAEEAVSPPGSIEGAAPPDEPDAAPPAPGWGSDTAGD